MRRALDHGGGQRDQPAAIGSFDASSSQVGFDGEKVAFLGIHQLTPTTTSFGIFVGDGGALTTLGKKATRSAGTAR